MMRMTPSTIKRVPWMSFLVTAVRKEEGGQFDRTRREEEGSKLTRSDLSSDPKEKESQIWLRIAL